MTLERLASALADRYHIERELGAGGMATVYLAEDLRHHRHVAIKVLKPELAAVLGAERFVQEIQTTAQLQHPHILPLFDSGTAGSQLFYVMPFIDGETLRDRLNRESQLGIDEAVRITREVADALDYAHRHGVVHRDIKPENILLHDGRPMVADFGIALAVSAAAGGRMTETGMSLGTPHYMSPEQATADKEITGRSDIYSLASVLYEMLTGVPPHQGGTAQQVIMKIIAEPAPPVNGLRRSVPRNVAAAVARALEKIPADRFATAEAFSRALADPHFGEEREPGTAGPRPRSRVALAAAGIAGLILGAAAMRWLGPRPGVASETTRSQLTFRGRATHPAISPDGTQVAYVDVECHHGQVALCRMALMTQEVGGTKAEALIRDAPYLATPRWTADGRTVLIAGILDSARQGLFAVPRLTGTPRLIGPTGAYDTHPTGDSAVLVSRGRGDTALVQVLDLQTAAVVRTRRLQGSMPSDVAWSPDGRRLALTDGYRLSLVNLDGAVTDSAQDVSRQVVRWSPDGRSLLYFRLGAAREDELVRRAVGADGRFRGTASVVLSRVPTLYKGEFDLARRSGDLALRTGDANTDIWSFDLASSPVRATRHTHGTTWYGPPALAHDGSALFYFQGDALGDNVYRLDLSTNVEEALTAQRLPAGSRLRFSADGRRLAYGHAAGSTSTLEFIEFPSRRITAAPVPLETAVVEPVGQSGFLGTLASSDQLAVADSLGAPWHVVPVDPRLQVVDYSASPDGHRVAIVALVAPSFGGSQRNWRDAPQGGSVIVAIAAVDGSAMTILDTVPSPEPVPGIIWSGDGTLWLGRWLASDEWPSLWRRPAGAGSLTRVAAIPAACTPSTLTVAARGSRAACEVDDFRSDIWLYRVPGVAR